MKLNDFLKRHNTMVFTDYLNKNPIKFYERIIEVMREFSHIFPVIRSIYKNQLHFYIKQDLLANALHRKDNISMRNTKLQGAWEGIK